MVFLCFRSKKANRNETSIADKKDQRKTASKDIKPKAVADKNVPQKKAVAVKLAPRTTLLKTPKQVVGARIAQALHDKQTPDLENMHSEMKRHSRSPSPTREYSSHSTITDQAQVRESEARGEEKTCRPTSPKLRASVNMLASNGVPNSELMEALARRAARQIDKKE